MKNLTNESKIKVVILDFDDTMYRGNVWESYGDYIEEFLTKLLKSREKALAFLEKYNLDFTSNGRVIATSLIKEFGTAKALVKYEHKHIYKLTIDKLKTISEDLIVKLKQKCSVYIVSNSSKRYVKYHLKKFGINPKLFNKIYQNEFRTDDSSKTRYYLDIVEREKVLKEEVLVVGDSYENDIVPAINLGMKSVWIKSLEEVENILIRLS